MYLMQCAHVDMAPFTVLCAIRTWLWRHWQKCPDGTGSSIVCYYFSNYLFRGHSCPEAWFLIDTGAYEPLHRRASKPMYPSCVKSRFKNVPLHGLCLTHVTGFCRIIATLKWNLLSGLGRLCQHVTKGNCHLHTFYAVQVGSSMCIIDLTKKFELWMHAWCPARLTRLHHTLTISDGTWCTFRASHIGKEKTIALIHPQFVEQCGLVQCHQQSS